MILRASQKGVQECQDQQRELATCQVYTRKHCFVIKEIEGAGLW
jgi:hypothetical protein